MEETVQQNQLQYKPRGEGKYKADYLAVDVFKYADIPGIVKCAAKMIEMQDCPVGSEILQRHINRELDLEYNKYFYLSLLRIHAPELGYPWYFAQDYVSKRKAEAE